MDEKEEGKPAAGDAGEGSEPKTTPTIDETNAAAERLEAANKEKKELLDREETLDAKRALGGGSEAGQPSKPKLSAEEKASRDRIKEVGKATGSEWAKDMEKEDAVL